MRRHETEAKRDAYIKSIALKVIRATGINSRDFIFPPEPQRTFADHIAVKVERWVGLNLTNPDTLTRVIQCALGARRGWGEENRRICPLCNVIDAESLDGDGLESLRYLAARTICAAIYDHFFFTEYAATPGEQRDAQREKDLSVEAQIKFYRSQTGKTSRYY